MKTKKGGKRGDEKASNFEASLKEQHFIAKIKREGSTAVKVYVNEFKDREALADVRVYYQKKGDKKMLPSGKGLSIPAAEIPALLKALKKAKAVLDELDGDGEEEE